MSDSDDDSNTCPLCVEEMDLSDKNFLPCPCGYRVCMWCWHHIRENLNGLCPACRTPYNADPHAFSAVDRTEIVKKNKERKQKEKQDKKLVTDKITTISGGVSVGGTLPTTSSAKSTTGSAVVDRRHLHNYRVIQRNLVYVIGLPANLASEELLRKAEYLGQYGKIGKVVIHRNHTNANATVSAYVTFVYKEDAKASIQSLEGYWLDSHNLRASFGTTKYCNNFIRGVSCSNPDCVYLHEMGDDDDRFTKEEIQAGQSKLTPTPGSNQTIVTGNGGPSGTGKKPTGETVFPPPVFLQEINAAGKPLSRSTSSSISDASSSSSSKRVETSSSSSSSSSNLNSVSSYSDVGDPIATYDTASKTNTNDTDTDSNNDSSNTNINNNNSTSSNSNQVHPHHINDNDNNHIDNNRVHRTAISHIPADTKPTDTSAATANNSNSGSSNSTSIASTSATGTTSKHDSITIAASFNGLGKCVVFPVPVSSFAISIWSSILNSSSSTLDVNPYGLLERPISELLDLTLPPVDAACMVPWPKPLSYYRQGAGADGSTHTPVGKHIHRQHPPVEQYNEQPIYQSPIINNQVDLGTLHQQLMHQQLLQQQHMRPLPPAQQHALLFAKQQQQQQHALPPSSFTALQQMFPTVKMSIADSVGMK